VGTGGRTIAVTDKKLPGITFADKEALLKILEEQDRRLGFVPDPTATAQKARAMMLARGVRPGGQPGVSRDHSRA
jgi:hypothetical protein